MCAEMPTFRSRLKGDSLIEMPDRSGPTWVDAAIVKILIPAAIGRLFPSRIQSVEIAAPGLRFIPIGSRAFAKVQRSRFLQDSRPRTGRPVVGMEPRGTKGSIRCVSLLAGGSYTGSPACEIRRTKQYRAYRRLLSRRKWRKSPPLRHEFQGFRALMDTRLLGCGGLSGSLAATKPTRISQPAVSKAGSKAGGHDLRMDYCFLQFGV